MDAVYATYQARLDSFAPPKPKARRASSTRGKKSAPKAAQKVAWPHASPSPEDMAYAGFVFHPRSGISDNAKCFSCQTELDGWEETDVPVFEHLTHSPNCGFAINIYIRIKTGDPGRTEDDPLSEHMLQARRMTFANLWPLDEAEGYPGVEQMINAGWYYDPSEEMPDGVTCPYCSLSLDAWDAGDDPTEEHRKRSADCLFFTLSEYYHPTQSKPARGKRASRRSSTASRTGAKSTRAKKGATSLDDTGMSLLDSFTDSISSEAAPAKRATKGRKTKKAQEDSMLADSLGESIMSTASKPPARGRRTKKAQEESIVVDSFTDSIAPTTSKAPAKGRKTKKAQEESIVVDSFAESVAATTNKATTRGRKAKKVQEEIVIADSFAESIAESVATTASKAPTKGRKTKKALARTSNASVMSTRTTRQRLEPAAPISSPKYAANQMDDFNHIGDISKSDIFASTPRDTPKQKAEARTSLASSGSTRVTRQKRTSEDFDMEDAPPMPSPKRQQVSELSRGELFASTPLHTPNKVVPTSSVAPSTRSTRQNCPSEAMEDVPMSSAKRSRISDLSRSDDVVASTPRGTPKGTAPVQPTTPTTPVDARPALEWEPIDVEEFFEKRGQFTSITDIIVDSGLDKENVAVGDAPAALVESIKARLTTPEKQMTVEQWVLYNAKRGEQQLRAEFEREITAFEAQGRRALAALDAM